MREYKDWEENLQWGRRKWLRTWKGNRGNSHKIQETQAKLAIKSVEKGLFQEFISEYNHLFKHNLNIS